MAIKRLLPSAKTLPGGTRRGRHPCWQECLEPPQEIAILNRRRSANRLRAYQSGLQEDSPTEPGSILACAQRMALGVRIMFVPGGSSRSSTRSTQLSRLSIPQGEGSSLSNAPGVVADATGLWICESAGSVGASLRRARRFGKRTGGNLSATRQRSDHEITTVDIQ